MAAGDDELLYDRRVQVTLHRQATKDLGKNERVGVAVVVDDVVLSVFGGVGVISNGT